MERNPVKSFSAWIGFWAVATALLFLVGCASTPAPGSALEIRVPRITKEELKSMIGKPEVIILDVRAALDWKESEWKITGAVREDRKGKSNEWMDKYPKDKIIVLYCA